MAVYAASATYSFSFNSPSISVSHFSEIQTIASRLVGRKRESEEFDSEELRRKRRRTRYPYDANLTISRIGEITHQLGITPLGPDNPWEGIIKEHAYRRIQIFYYQALFYYKEDCDISMDKTIIQHGQAKCSCCSAAHSAILPGLIDSKGLMKQDLQIYHNMNSTVEMPSNVNAYDCVIESEMRPKALEILNLVAKGMHPYEATEYFVKCMQTFFQKSSVETQLKIDLHKKIKQQENIIFLLENQRVKDPIQWTRNYVKAVFELKEWRDEFQKAKQYSMHSHLDKYPYPRHDLFHFLWSNCADLYLNLQMMTKVEHLEEFLKKNPCIPRPQEQDFRPLKRKLAEYLKQTHRSDLWLASPQIASELFNKISLYLPCMPPLPLDTDFQSIQTLKDSQMILKLQSEGTNTPAYNLLSGKKVKGKLVGYNEDELLKHKKILQEDKVELS